MINLTIHHAPRGKNGHSERSPVETKGLAQTERVYVRRMDPLSNLFNNLVAYRIMRYRPFIQIALDRNTSPKTNPSGRLEDLGKNEEFPVEIKGFAGPVSIF